MTGQPKHRWFRFSLRTLLLLIAIFAVWLGATVNQARRQQKSLTAIRDLGGWVRYDYQMVDGRFDPKAESWVPQWLLQLIGEDMFHDVVVVNLVYNVDGPQRLDNDLVTDEALKHLQGLPKLKELYLHETQATDEGLKHVGRLKHLEKLFMWDASQVGDFGIRQLEDLKSLEYIHVSNSRITDEALRVFGRLPNLEGLSLQGNRFTDRGLEHLKGLTHLKSLWVGVGETRITDDGLTHLYGLTNLVELDIQGSPVTRKGIERLQEVLPNVRVYHAMLERRNNQRKGRGDVNRPELQFMSWQHDPPDDPQARLEGPYWLPNGQQVDDQSLLAPLRQIPGWNSDGFAKGSKFLHLFVSHTGFTHDSTGEIDLVDKNGKVVDITLQNISSKHTRFASPHGPAWLFFQVWLNPGLRLPDVGTVRLRFTAGEWQRLAAFSIDTGVGERLAEGVTLLGIGDNAGGECFVALIVDASQTAELQYTVTAKGKDGQILPLAGILHVNPRNESHAFTFQFRHPLASVVEFELRGRARLKTEFHDVSLRPGYITMD